VFFESKRIKSHLVVAAKIRLGEHNIGGYTWLGDERHRAKRFSSEFRFFGFFDVSC